jgi:branched-chain amino acid transport system ATP-binding protein
MILQIDGITKRFGGLVAVDSVSLSVEEREIFGLIGPNGAGKTTLLNVIAGVYKPDAGTVAFNGEGVTGLRPHRICQKGVARTFQVCRPFPKMSALESVMVAAVFGNRTAVKHPEAWAEEVLEFVEFPMPKDMLAENLNILQLKRLDLARALASNPKLLLLDEIGAGLTPAELVDLMGLIRRMNERSITIVVVEHLMKMIMEICDRMAVLYYGEKIAVGTPRQIARDERVIDAYLGEEYLLGEEDEVA